MPFYTMRIIAVIENEPITEHEDGSLHWRAKAAIDSDGVGPHHGDRTATAVRCAGGSGEYQVRPERRGRQPLRSVQCLITDDRPREAVKLRSSGRWDWRFAGLVLSPGGAAEGSPRRQPWESAVGERDGLPNPEPRRGARARDHATVLSPLRGCLAG